MAMEIEGMVAEGVVVMWERVREAERTVVDMEEGAIVAVG